MQRFRGNIGCGSRLNNKNRETGVTSNQTTDSDSAARWRHVYLAVVAFTAVIFALLYLFSSWFAG